MKDYLTPSKYPKNYEEELEFIRFQINQRIKNKDNFLGVDFSDVSAGGIQVRGHHNLIKGYCYPFSFPTLKYDFSNVEEVIDEFVYMWDSSNNDKNINDAKRFLADGNKYGWD